MSNEMLYRNHNMLVLIAPFFFVFSISIKKKKNIESKILNVHKWFSPNYWSRESILL